MARFYPGLMGLIVGSVGSDTFSKNASGYYIKKKAIPTNPNTPEQAAARNRMKLCVQYWKNTLTGAEADSWRHAASLHNRSKYGSTFNLSGINLFCGYNTLATRAGIAMLDAPTIFEGAVSSELPVISEDGAGKLQIAGWQETDVNMRCFVYATNAVSRTIGYKKGAFVWTSTQLILGGVYPEAIDVAYPGSGLEYRCFVGFRFFKIGGAISEMIHTHEDGSVV